MQSTAIHVDLTAIERNVEAIRKSLAKSEQNSPGLCAILKANAYGLGAARVAKRLSILGVDMIAVNTPEQARELVEAAITSPILLLMPIRKLNRNDALYRAASRGQIHFSIHDLDHLHAIMDVSHGLGITMPVHVELDTGMSRGGTNAAQAEQIVIRIREHRRLRLAGVYTHLACADVNAERTEAQNAAFDAWLDRIGSILPDDCLIHEANTPATFRNSRYARRMVRIGLGLFGYAREEFADPDGFDRLDDASTLSPALRMVSRVMQVKMIEAGAAVGYGSTWTAERPTRLALVPVGYADGYPLALSNRGAVALARRDGSVAHAPVVGRVSMDQMTVDVTDLSAEDVRIGAEVEVIGARPDAPNYLPTLAHAAGTTTYELLCRLNARLPRRYIALEEARSSTARTFAIGESMHA
ncbi:MAG: alanine racemase [Phycisphaerales bacterium]